jgi:hypothetical protein
LVNCNNRVHYYNWKLDKMKTIGQIKDKDLTFYFKYVLQMDIRNKTFYLRRLNSIDIVDEKTGDFLKFQSKFINV